MTRKPKVVHLTSVHARYDNRILFKQCVSLAKHGYNTYLIVADGKGDEVFQDVNIIDVGKKGRFFYRVTNTTRKIYLKAKRINAEIYQIHDPELLPVAFKLNRKGVKVVYDVHEDYVTSIGQKRYLSSFFKWIFLKVYIALEEKAKKQLTILLAEKYYKDRFPNGHLVLNYPIVKEDHTASLKARQMKKGEDRKLLYTGNVTEDRGALTQSILVDKVDKISITFVGHCSSRLAQKMKMSVKKNNAINFVGINKYIAPTTIKRYYDDENWLAGLAIFPKTKHYEKKELTKFFEYMLHGLPIICSDFPAWKRFVEEHQCGFAVDPTNYQQIGEAINLLAEDSSLQQDMAENGMRKVLQELNWGTQSRNLFKIYESLLTK